MTDYPGVVVPVISYAEVVLVSSTVIKRNDLMPTLDVVLQAPLGTPFDLTGSTVKFIMLQRSTNTVKVNAAATITNSTAGAVTYSWTGTDTDTAGTYVGEFQVTLPSGKTRTFPERGYLYIDVQADLGN